MDFPDQRQRLRRMLDAALAGATYVKSSKPDESSFVLEARKEDGRRAKLRFLGVKDASATGEPGEGATLSLESVGSSEKFSIARLFLPRFLRTAGPPDSRVRIKAGNQRIDIVCQDAEWYEDGIR